MADEALQETFEQDVLSNFTESAFAISVPLQGLDSSGLSRGVMPIACEEDKTIFKGISISPDGWLQLACAGWEWLFLRLVGLDARAESVPCAEMKRK